MSPEQTLSPLSSETSGTHAEICSFILMPPKSDITATCIPVGASLLREGGTSREVYTKAGRLLHAEVFDAEVYAALQGLAAARVIAFTKRLFVCLNNTLVVDGLTGTPPELS